MISNRVAKRSEDIPNYNKSIMNWCMGREKILNVVAPPYSSSVIFLDAIMYYVNRDKKVLYITGENQQSIEMIENIKKATDFRKYSYLRKSDFLLKANLIITDYERVMDLKEQYDLVIYDDIRSYSDHTSCEIIEAVIKTSKDNNKIICYSIESVFKNAREIEVPVRSNAMPIAEPRIITTRIDIKKDMPYVIYEYISWSMEADRRVIIYTYDRNLILNLYEYFRDFKNELCKNILFYIKGEDDKKSLLNFSKFRKSILITNDFYEPDPYINDIDVLVYYADDKRFTVKNLVFFCGKVGRGEKTSKGEVIFLGNEITNSMEMTKNMTRHFNKEAWEMNLLRI